MKKAIERSLTAKISLAVMAVLVFFVSATAIIDVHNENENVLEVYKKNAALLAMTVEKSFISAMKEGRNEDVQKVLEEIGTQEGIVGVRIFDEKGNILRSDKKGEIGGTVDGDILSEYRKIEEGEKSVIESGSVFSLIKPIYNGPECFGCHPAKRKVNGVLNVRISMEDAYREMDANRWFMIKWAILTILCVGLSQIMLLRLTVGRPVMRLRSAMLKAERGENSRIELAGEDELWDLGRVFNNMMGKINELGLEAVEREKELVRHQEALRSQALIASVINGMADGVAIIDRDMRLQLVNPSYRKLLPHVKAGDICYASVHKRERTCPQCGVAKVFEDGSIHEHESNITMPDGSVKVVHSISGPLMDDSGSVCSAVEVMRDITDRVALEHELKEKTWELERANKKLAQMAVTDGLTMLYNHRFFQENLKKEFRRIIRHRALPLISLAMIDIDDFKKLNDAYGHQAGDEVLKRISRILKESVRITDTVARYGGEEFVILMPETNFQGTEVVAERIRKNVEDAVFEYEDKKIKITVSIGLASYPQEGIVNEDDLLKAADGALYKAKEYGKNRVEVSKGLLS